MSDRLGKTEGVTGEPKKKKTVAARDTFKDRTNIENEI